MRINYYLCSLLNAVRWLWWSCKIESHLRCRYYMKVMKLWNGMSQLPNNFVIVFKLVLPYWHSYIDLTANKNQYEFHNNRQCFLEFWGCLISWWIENNMCFPKIYVTFCFAHEWSVPSLKWYIEPFERLTPIAKAMLLNRFATLSTE